MSSGLYEFVCPPPDLDQVHIILNVIGSPSQEDLTSVTSEQVTCSVHYSHSMQYSMMAINLELGTSLLAESPTTTSSTLVKALLSS